MYRACARIGGDIGAQNAQHATLQKRMLEGGALQRRAFEAGDFRGRA